MAVNTVALEDWRDVVLKVPVSVRGRGSKQQIGTEKKYGKDHWHGFRYPRGVRQSRINRKDYRSRQA
jgi:hypothetical protein